jgi:hypothetical protein
MKLSTKQAMMLLDIAKDSLHILGPIGGYSPQIRLQLVNDVINQQSNTLTDTDEPNEDKS